MGEQASGVAGTPGRLLVVDDFDLNREALSRRLRRSGFYVAEADHGSKVLPMLEREAYDLVLLDVMMPEVDGIEVLKAVRGKFSMGQLPVIMLSAKEESAVVVEAFKLGANDYVTKPIDYQVTLARINSLLSRRTSLPAVEVDSTSIGDVEVPLAEMVELATGTVVGSYTVQGVLGRGGMGIVYEALHQDLGRRAALKLMNEETASNSERAARFRREARAAARIDHPNIVSIYEVGMWRGHFFMAMQLAEGESAGALLLKTGRMPWRQATTIMAAVCRGLSAAHERGVLHRDIKPDNIVMGTDGSVKLLDFGIAKFSEPVRDDDQTRAGQLVGTPHFMSPEQCQFDTLDARSDVYQAGATYFTLLSGRKPYSHHQGVFDVMLAQCTEETPDLRQDFPDVPAACCEVVMRAMSKPPGERYQSAADMALALELALAGDPAV